MARLRHSEVEALSQILLELYSPCSYTDFPVRLFVLLRRCFSFDFFDYREIANNRNERNFVYPECKPKIGVFKACMHPPRTFFLNDPEPTQTYFFSLHDALRHD